MSAVVSGIAKLLDHSLLAPVAKEEDFRKAVQIARLYQTATVCLVPYFVAEAARMLEGTGVGVCSVVGFPHGMTSAPMKAKEAELLLQDGASELDMVVNISLVKSGDFLSVREELRWLRDVTSSAGAKIKLIFETCYLDQFEKEMLCDLASEYSFDWVKTSSGFGSAGATLDDVRLMRARAEPHVQVKASGGIRTLDEVLAYRAAGATRIGTSGTIQILREAREREGLPPLEPDTGEPTFDYGGRPT